KCHDGGSANSWGQENGGGHVDTAKTATDKIEPGIWSTPIGYEPLRFRKDKNHCGKRNRPGRKRNHCGGDGHPESSSKLSIDRSLDGNACAGDNTKNSPQKCAHLRSCRRFICTCE